MDFIELTEHPEKIYDLNLFLMQTPYSEKKESAS